MWVRLGGSGTFGARVEAVSLMLSWALALCAAMACAAWVATRLFLMLGKSTGGSRWRGLLPHGVAAAAAIPGLWWFSSRLLSGPQISQSEYVGLLRIALPVAGCIAVAIAAAILKWAGITAARGNRFIGGSAGVVCLAGFVLLDWWDSTQFRTANYEYVHGVATAATFLCGYSCFLFLTSSYGNLRRPSVALGAGVVLLAGIGASVIAPTSPFVRFELVEKGSTRGRHLSAISEYFLQSPLPDEGPVEADTALADQRRATRLERPALLRRLDANLGARDDWNLLWITVDTLRADHLQCYGYDRPTSPAMDALAHGGVLFENNYAQNAITHFSFQSMFYGRYPSATPLFREIRRLPDRTENSLTLADVLTKAGFDTACIPAIPAASLSHPTYEILARGFSEVNPGRRGDRLDAPTQSDLAIRWLKKRGQGRWFLWLHFFDPHHPYLLHDKAGFGESMVDRYDGEIAAADGGVKQVLGALEQGGMADRTIVVLNGDHGEALGDHDTDFHGSTLYEEQIKVPLLMRVPRIAPRRVRTVVENVDIMPTVLDLLSVDAQLPLQGESLAPLLLDGDEDPHSTSGLALSELPDAVRELSPDAANLISLRLGDLKLIYNQRRRISELYDLAADPGELRNLAYERKADVIRLRAAMQALQDECLEINTPDDERTKADPLGGLRAALRASPPIPQRSLLLAEATRAEVEGIDAFLFEVLEDPKEHPVIKSLLVRHAIPRDATRALPAALAALDQRLSWGYVRSALEGLHDLDGAELSGLGSELTTRLHALLSGPGPVARHAARLLARLGDDAGAAILLEDVKGPDRVVAFEAACALAHLGDGKHAGLIRRAVLERRLQPKACVRALRALTVIRDLPALPEVARLVDDQFLFHGIKRAAIDYLTAVGGERVLPAFVLLLKGWDPVLKEAAEAALDVIVGEPRRRELRGAARLFVSAQDLMTQGRWRAACDAFEKAAAACGTPHAAVLMNLYAARSASRVGDEERLRMLAKAVLDVTEEPAYGRAAQALLDADKPGRPRHTASIVGLELTKPKPLRPGRWMQLRVRLRNTGTTTLPGGSWGGGVAVAVKWSSGGRDSAAAGPPSFLPEAGLAPGADAELHVRAQAPTTAGEHQAVPVLRLASATPLHFVHEHEAINLALTLDREAALDPRDLVFKGGEIARHWGLHPGFAPWELEPDGNVTLAALTVDPWMAGPTLKDVPIALEVSIELAIGPTTPTRQAELEVYWTHDPDALFSPGKRAVIPVPTDGRYHRVAHLIPLHEGRAIRRVRIDPGGLPALYSIREIRIRAAPR
ncbi:MAG: sulfatase-like hydrolase/transferase [Planctomycetota bacterium]|nr:sulfatase-like hydrolase/transferase [Planctomycetota bacterium]